MMCDFLKFLSGTVERPSPSDWVPKSAISVVSGVVMVDMARISVGLSALPIVWIPEIPDTNSMDGCFDYGNNNILIKGATPEDHTRLVDHLAVGDIAVYSNIIHRIIKIDTDEEGKFYRFKGDNNSSADKTKVRPSEIRYISVGTIY